jgi:hypothetical protein
MIDLITRVTIFSIGIDTYDDLAFRKLSGVANDLDNIKHLLINNSRTAIYKEKQYTELKNCTSSELREKLNTYILSRSADNDIFLLYFSGHGVAVGRNDFGFCTKDTIIHKMTNVVLPSSIFTFSELLNSLYIANIIPIIIIDACYSGIAGREMEISSIESISLMKDKLHNNYAGSYALFCSCSENRMALESFTGGVFSSRISSLIKNGRFIKSKKYISLLDLYKQLSEDVYTYSIDNSPRLFIGNTIPEIPFCKNPSYKPQKYTLHQHLSEVLFALWNNGKNRMLTPQDIDRICGKGAYGNHNKLSLPPWALVEDVPYTKNRRLSKRGIEFVSGKISIPKQIIQNQETGKWEEVIGTKHLYINELSQNFILFPDKEDNLEDSNEKPPHEI